KILSPQKSGPSVCRSCQRAKNKSVERAGYVPFVGKRKGRIYGDLWHEEVKRNTPANKSAKPRRSRAVTRNAASARRKHLDAPGRRSTNRRRAAAKRAAVVAERNGVNRARAKADEKAAAKRSAVNR